MSATVLAATAPASPLAASAGMNAVGFAVVLGLVVVAVLVAAFWWGSRRAARRRHPVEEPPPGRRSRDGDGPRP
ncbi:DUF6479 family protein [Streptomyces termitum]|uniref:DUF6479 family protein n=1 Tax=Streptomyces termitum TaxID=67368 RepID=UPI0033BD279A